MLLRNEGAVIKWLSQYEAIERRQLKEMINKSLNSSDSFVNSMLKQSRIANLEDGYIGLDHLCKPDYKLIKAIWILIEFIKNVEPMAHYPATYPSQLFFLLENKGYEVIVLDEGDEDLLKRVQFNSEVTYTLKNPTTLYNYQTHEYLGDYLRFLRDFEGINLMSMYNCFSNRLCNNIKVVDPEDRELPVINAYDSNYKIYMLPVKLFEKYTIAIDCYQGIELFCGLYNEKLDTSDKAKNLIKKTY